MRTDAQREQGRIRSQRYRLRHKDEINARRRAGEAKRRELEDAHPEIYGVRKRVPRFVRSEHPVDDVAAGSFTRRVTSPRVAATQVNREPLERLQSLFGGPICKQGGPSRLAYNPRGQEAWYWSASGDRARYVIEKIEGHMSAKRKGQIGTAVNGHASY